MMKFGKKTLTMLAVVAGVMLLAQAAGADVVTLGTETNRLGEAKQLNGSRVYTNGTEIVTGTQVYSGGTFLKRSLMAFDLSDLIADGYDTSTCTVDSITLKLTLWTNTSGGPENAVSVYGVSQDEGDWTFATASTIGPAAFGGLDSTVLGTHQFPTSPDVESGVISIAISGTDLTALINTWINDKNAGLGLVGYESATSTLEARYQMNPELVVEYSVPEPATMAMLGLGGVMMLIRRRRKVA